MTYIFAPSYQTILFSLHQFRFDEITYVTYNPSIKRFAEKVGIAVIYREEQTDLSVKGYKDYRRLCQDMIKDWKDREILFCYYGSDVWGLYQLFRLRKNNKVFFYNTDNLSAPGFDESTSIYFPVVNNSLSLLFNERYRRIFIRQKLIYLITGFHFDLMQFEKDSFFPAVSLKRIRKIFLPFKKQFDETVFKKNTQAVLASVNLPPTIDILFIDSGSDGIKYTAELTAALKEVVKQYSLTLIVKPHPTFKVPEGLAGFVQADKSIPAELLGEIPVVVMGLASNALISIAKYNFTVSLVNLVKFETDELNRYFKKMVSLEPKIHAPGTIEDLKDLLRKKLE